MYYSDEIVEEVRNRSEIVSVIGSYVRLKRSGANYSGLCPFHNEKSPSFMVSQSKQMFKCFGCGVGGNVYSFIMQYENYTFPEAVKFLAERAGMELPDAEQTEEEKRNADIRTKLLEINKKAAVFYYKQLYSRGGEAAYAYLTGRKLTDETIKKFGLGYSGRVNGSVYEYLKHEGYSDSLIMESGLVSVSEQRGAYDKFWDRVMFPIMDANNRVIAFGGRVMGKGEPKYLNSPETKLFDKSRNLYGLNYAKQERKNQMLLCEGYMDVISLHQAGFGNAVASLGTAFTGLQANILKRYVKEALLTYDSDGPGVKAALRAIPILRNVGITAKVVNMQPYKDPDEFIKALGAEEYQKRIDNAREGFYFEIDVMLRDYDMNNPERKLAFYHAVADKLLDYPDELARDVYAEAVAREYNLDILQLKRLVVEHAVLSDARNIGRKTDNALVEVNTGAGVAQDRQKGTMKKADSAVSVNQKSLITYMASDRRYYEVAKKYISQESFENEYHKKIVAMISEAYEGDPAKQECAISSFMDRFRDIESNKEANEALSTETFIHTELDDSETKTQTDKAFLQALMSTRLSQLEKEQAEAAKDNDTERYLKVLKEINTVKKEIPQIRF